MSTPDPNDPTWQAFCTPSTEHAAKVRKWITDHQGRDVRLILSAESEPDPNIPDSPQHKPVLTVTGPLMHFDPVTTIGDLVLEPEFLAHVAQVISGPAGWIDMHIASGTMVRIEQHPLYQPATSEPS